MVVLGVIIFAGASALCGSTPQGSAAETWLIVFRALQGLGGALMFPAALAIVVVAFDLRSTRPGPGDLLRHQRRPDRDRPDRRWLPDEWTWRSIFWINIPVALIALVLIVIAKSTERGPSRADGLPRPGPGRGGMG